MKTKPVEPPVEIGALVLYDSVPAGKCAKELCDRLQRRLGWDCKLNVVLWNLAALRIPSLALSLIDAVTQPELLIFSVAGNKPLPETVRRWTCRYVRKTRAAKHAIVGLFHGVLRTELTLSPAYDGLKRIADQSGVDFFSGAIELMGNDLAKQMDEIHGRSHLQSLYSELLLQLHSISI